MPDLIPLIIRSLNCHYSIGVARLTPLLLGADIQASIYKAQAHDQKTYFVKLKQGDCSYELNTQVLKLLQTNGIKQIIAPINTVQSDPSCCIEGFTLIVYPFIEGKDGFSHALTDNQWITLGKTLRQIHEIKAPDSLKRHIRQETFSPKWRKAVRSLYAYFHEKEAKDEVSLKLWEFFQKNRSIIEQLTERSEQLSQTACGQSHPFVLCHGDIHGGNVLITDNHNFYIVDWDDPLLAPKERDLMFIGAGVANVWNKELEENLFYQGYGQTDLNWDLLTYYRYERIVEDIAIYGEELLLKSSQDAESRLEMYNHFMGMFEPGGVVDIAFKTDKHRSN